MATLLVLAAAAAGASERPGPAPGDHHAAGLEDALREAARTLDELAASGVDRSAMAGVLTRDEARRAEAAATRVIELVHSEAAGGARALVEGRARLLLAACAETEATRQAEARRAAACFLRERLAATAPEGLRRVSLAGALWMAGHAPDEDAGEGPGPIELVESVLDLPVGEDALRTVGRGVMAEAMCLRVLMSAGEAQAAALTAARAAVAGGVLSVQRRPEAGMELVLAELEARLSLLRSGGEAPDAATVERGLRALVALAGPSAGANPPAMAVLARGKVAAVVEGSRVPVAGLPAGARLAWATEAVAWPGRADEARRELRELAAADEALAPAALAALAGSLDVEPGAAREAMGVRLDLIERFGGDPRAAAAVGRLAAGWRALTEDRQEAALRALDRRLPAGEAGQAVRLELASRVASAATAWSAQRMDEVLRLLDAAGAQEEVGAIRARAIADFARRVTEAPEVATAEHVGAARRLLAWAAKGAPGDLPRYHVLLGSLLVRESTTRSEGLALLESVVAGQGGGDAVQREAMMRLREGCSSAAETQRAFAAIKRVADGLDRPIPAPVGSQGPTRPPLFWHAWAELLTMMQADNASGGRSGDIRLQIRLLETLDPALGGGAAAERVRVIAKAIGE